MLICKNNHHFIIAEKLLNGYVEKKKMSQEDRDAVMGRIIPTTSLFDLGDANFVVEVRYTQLQFLNATTLLIRIIIVCCLTFIIGCSRKGRHQGKDFQGIVSHY